MITYPEAEFRFVDVAACSDSAAASEHNQDFAAIAALKDDIRMELYGTMELNQFILDGSRKVFPQKPWDIAFWSMDKSDEDGHFTVVPKVTVSFSALHSSVGITLYFAEDVPEEVRITWFSPGGTKLDSQLFQLDSNKFFCRKEVRNYGRIEIEFLKTAWPDRYVKMNYAVYGRIWKLSRENIKTASICEELDPISSTLPVNTANIEIVDENAEFDLKEEGLWHFLQRDQSIQLKEYQEGKAIDCGTYYLDKWDVQQSIVSFSMIDQLGRMDKARFYDGRIYENERAGSIIDEIMGSCGVENYVVDQEIADILLSGWLGIQSHREALQQVVFACGALAECSRSGEIRIFRQNRYISSTIGLERKFLGTKITLDDYVSGVSVSCMRYFPTEEVTQISRMLLKAGDTRIEFPEPYLPESIIVSSGIIKQAKTNFAVVTMPLDAECIISGKKYGSSENAYIVSLPVKEAGESENVKTYSGITLMNAGLIKDIAENILHHFQARQIVELRYLNYGEAVGNWCSIAQPGGFHSVTGILSQTLDLAGGFLASAKCRGYSKAFTSYCFTGNELYAGEQCL